MNKRETLVPYTKEEIIVLLNRKRNEKAEKAILFSDNKTLKDIYSAECTVINDILAEILYYESSDQQK